MFQKHKLLSVATHGQGLYDVTGAATDFAATCAMSLGILYVFCQHTSASLLIQENADPDVQRDLMAFFKRLVPDGDPLFSHTSEGPDDMPAHVKAALTQTTLTIPINNSRLMLGTWQGLYVFEHRRAPHKRAIVLHAIGA